MRKTIEVVENKAPAVGVLCGLENSELNDKATSILDVLNKMTEAKNKKFSEMTKNEKRVALAQDVLASLKSNKYIATTGTYVEVEVNGEYTCLDQVNTSTILMESTTCTVCAIGSLFLSNAKQKKNKTLTSDSDKMASSLRGIFTSKEMRMLEYIFEGEDVNTEFTSKRDEVLCNDMHSFYIKHTGGSNSDDKTLKAIMNNIIKNNGNFIYKSINI